MSLSSLQRQLAASLAGDAPAPAGCSGAAVNATRRALENKRSRAAAHLLPGIRAALNEEWVRTFNEHAARYRPAGLLYHIDDAWAFALTLRRHTNRRVQRAAADALLALRIAYVRDRRAQRIRPRRGLLLAARYEPFALVCRLPGSRGRVVELSLPSLRRR